MKLPAHMKSKNSLRFKILIPSLFLAVALTGIILALFWKISDNYFLSVEKTMANKDLTIIANAITAQIENLSSEASQWSVWDDSYNFLVNHNQQFVLNNLQPSSLKSMNIDSMVYVGKNANIVYQGFINLNTATEATPPASLVNFLTTYPYFKKISSPDSHIEGVVSLADGPFMFSAQPVTKSDGIGDFVGTIVLGRFIDKEAIDNIAELVNQPFSFVAVTTSADNPTITPNWNNKYLDGEIPYKDINGINSFEIQAAFPRQILSAGQQFLYLSTLGAGVSIVIFSLLMIRIFAITAINPISELAGMISKISDKNDYSARIPETTKLDEISQVAKSINSMLEQLEYNKIVLEEKIKLTLNQNEDLENNRKVMLNLLEDSRSLEKDLKQERDRAQTIISSMGEGLIVVDSNYHITMINRAAAAMLESNPEAAVGQVWSDLYEVYTDQEIIPVSDRSFNKVLSTGKALITQTKDNHYYQTKSGVRFPISSITTPLISQENKIIGAIKVFRNVTEEKEATKIIESTVQQRTKELQWEKARLTTSINSLPNGFILTDPAGKILVINQAAISILNLSQNVNDFSEIIDKFKTYFDIQTASSDCQKENKTMNIPEITMETQYIRLFISPIFAIGDDARSYLGTAYLITDITEQKILERSKDEFFSIASHELRTPLTAIRGNTSMILDYYGEKVNDPDLHSMINDIRESSVRLIGIVNDFLDVSRLEQSRMQFKKVPFEVIQLAGEVIKELKTTVPPPVVELNVIPPTAPIAQVVADRDRTKQVLFNLIGNALKFTPKGSINISAAQNGDHVEISVTDTGRGIPKEQQILLFHKFQQAGVSLFTRDTSGGTGLGLYISKLLVEGMGGHVQLTRSDIDIGSTFTFTLPTT
jgi:PAS domain S-box-containing protein